MKPSMINLAIMGYGTVGSGVYEIAQKNAQSIQRKSGQEIRVARILDLRDFPDHPQPELFTKDFNDILDDPQINVVAEVIGGITPAYDYTKAALMAGKSVVTSNKELVATHGTELLALAAQNNVRYMFEASVGGGIPIIHPLTQCLAANELSEITGILNGTTNYILTKMIKKGQSFEEALADAQAKGYAERNPAADVEGHDACRKICILASLAFGKAVDCGRIHTEGITNITLQDVKYAEQLGYVIKLIGYSKREDGKVLCRVSPMLISEDHPLSGVEDVFNAIMVHGDSIGDVMFYGRGAGKLPTASAVMADVIDIVKGDGSCYYGWSDSSQDFLEDYTQAQVALFVRMGGITRQQVTEIFGDVAFALAEDSSKEVIFITPADTERTLQNKIAAMGKPISTIRVLQS